MAENEIVENEEQVTEEAVEDTAIDEETETVEETGEPKYSVMLGGEWTADVVGNLSYAGRFGETIEAVRINGVGKYRVYNRKTGWSEWSDGYDTPAGDGSGVLMIELEDEDVNIGVHVKGGNWLEIKKAHGGCMLPIDVVWMARA